MTSERSNKIKLVHAITFSLITVSAFIALAIAASLLSFYNDVGYPSGAYRDRIRITLVASIWTGAFGLYLLVGVLVASSNVLFGIAIHIFSVAVGFLLFLIGAASLTALTDKAGACNFARCNIVKGLVAISWIETIFLFVALLAVVGAGMKSRSGAGIKKGVLTDA